MNLTQKKFFSGTNQFELLPGGRLSIKGKSSIQSFEHTIGLGSFDPNYSSLQTRDFRPLVFVVPAAGVTLFAFLETALYIFSGLEKNGTFGAYLFIDFFFGMLTCLLCFNMSQKWNNIIIFTNRAGETLTLWRNRPNQAEFDRFVSALQKAMTDFAVVPEGVPHETSMANEISKLKKLRDEGVLDAEQFEAAKNKLTGKTTRDKIGF